MAFNREENDLEGTEMIKFSQSGDLLCVCSPFFYGNACVWKTGASDRTKATLWPGMLWNLNSGVPVEEMCRPEIKRRIQRRGGIKHLDCDLLSFLV